MPTVKPFNPRGALRYPHIQSALASFKPRRWWTLNRFPTLKQSERIVIETSEGNLAADVNRHPDPRGHAVLIHGWVNKPLNTSYIYEFVAKLVIKRFPGRRITPHSFRKSFIELTLNNNEDFISIINATGHSTVEMVKYYDTRDRLKNNAIHGMSGLI